ncbi:RnfABCDGE type electron transport complex subunit D [Ruminococcaceae bacterium OttesenSCG-928-A16]|nr:RnfABCDGE type electron transport complex subunit D [Ruminococcaceae bacterium OttesenSCG-928-A16]
MPDNQNKLVVAASPHITSRYSTRMLMGGVCIALLPTLIASAFIFGPRVLLLTAVTVATCVGFEWLYCLLMKKTTPIGDLSAVVTGLILAFNLPPSFPLWMAAVGSLISIVVVKQLFGGIGFNFANPALVGRIVLQLSFTGNMISYSFPRNFGGVDALASATPLAAMGTGQNLPMIDMLLGTHGGTLGETCALTLLLGGLFLIATKIISPVIPLFYLGGTFVFKLVLSMGSAGSLSAAFAGFGGFAWNSLLYLMGGGLLLGAFFMATDYTTSPYTLKGKIVFGLGLAIITVAIREWSKTAEGVSYALLLMNLFVPYINALCRQKPVGVKKKKPAKTRKEAA